jgi:hypothetical protein
MKLSITCLLLVYLLFTSIISHALTNSSAQEDLAYQSNVFIGSAAIADDRSPVTAYCNATALSAQVLVTAAHCIVESLEMTQNQIHIEVGNYRYTHRKSDGKLVRIGYVPILKKDASALFIVSKNLQLKIASGSKNLEIPPNEDIAIVILNEKLELDSNFIFANIVPQDIWQNLRDHLDEAPFFIVSINYLEVSTNDTKRSSVLNKFSYTAFGWLESQSLSRVEEGDSGSPVFVHIRGQDYLVAVVKGLASNIFSNWDVMPALSGKACEIANENSLTSEISSLVCK